MSEIDSESTNDVFIPVFHKQSKPEKPKFLNVYCSDGEFTL